MRLSALLSQCNIPIPQSKGGLRDPEITGIAFDSRKAAPGTLFVCIEGSQKDGHDFAPDAVRAGAAAVIAQKSIEVEAPLFLVPDTKEALARLSGVYYGRPAENGLTVIGVTGTKGKTTTAHMICSILNAAGHKTGMIGTIGVTMGERVIPTDNTTPSSVEIQKTLSEMREEGYEFCVLEASSIGLRDKRLFGIPFRVGVFTNFSEDHIGGAEHKDIDEYLSSKALLFSMCKTGVVNLDDPALPALLKGHTCDLLTYGFTDRADLYGSGCRHLDAPGKLGVAFETGGAFARTVEVPLPGRFNAANALAAMLTCHALGASVESILAGIRNVRVKGRVEIVPLPEGCPYTLILDYAHNGAGLQNILSTLREYNPARLICLFGAGGNRPKIRRTEMGEVSGRLADLSVLTADNSRYEATEDIIEDIKVGIARTGGKYVVIPDRKEAMRYCIETAREGDIIVFAGKGHEDYQEISGVKLPFDERKVIAEIFRDLQKKG